MMEPTCDETSDAFRPPDRALVHAMRDGCESKDTAGKNAKNALYFSFTFVLLGIGHDGLPDCLNCSWFSV